MYQKLSFCVQILTNPFAISINSSLSVRCLCVDNIIMLLSLVCVIVDFKYDFTVRRALKLLSLVALVAGITIINHTSTHTSDIKAFCEHLRPPTYSRIDERSCGFASAGILLPRISNCTLNWPSLMSSL